VRPNVVKDAIASGDVVVGTWLHTLGLPTTMQVLAASGFDYVYIDMEHSGFSIETVVGLCTAGQHAGIVPVIRPPGPDDHLIGRVLDNGAWGVLMPHVDTPEQAEAAVRAVKFIPDGQRGSSPTNVHSDFGSVDFATYMREFNERSLVIVQIESPEAVANLDAIMAVDGVDGATLGRGDYAIEIGHAGERDHPEVTAAVEAMIAACQRHGKAPGLLVFSVEDGQAWRARGVLMLTYSSEIVMLRESGRSAVEQLRPA
jgi:2-keto-3-deoxy-L-rhamnonate aldolase RhmA